MITITTFLRAVILSDVFDKDGCGAIIENKQYFYKNADKSISGPFRLNPPFDAKNLHFYEEIFQLIHEKRMLMVENVEYLESIAIALPLKKVEAHDILQSNKLIVNTAYFLKSHEFVEGSFYIKEATTKESLKSKIGEKTMLVFTESQTIKKLHKMELMIG